MQLILVTCHLSLKIKGRLESDGGSENGGPKCNDVCAHRVERGVLQRKNAGRTCRAKANRSIRTRVAHRLNEPNAGSRHKVQKQLQKARASGIREPCKRISEEAAKETTKQMAELRERYPDAFIHDAVDPRVTLCKVMAYSDCRDG